MKRLFVIAAAVGMFVSGPGTALAGEVKGPPGTINNTNTTAGPANANSACVFSGLNDYDLNDPEGQLDSQVQTAADSWKIYELPKGTPGTFFGGPGLCRGGTNGAREK